MHEQCKSVYFFFVNMVLFSRERTPPRPQGQRPEPENRGVSTFHKYTWIVIQKVFDSTTLCQVSTLDSKHIRQFHVVFSVRFESWWKRCIGWCRCCRANMFYPLTEEHVPLGFIKCWAMRCRGVSWEWSHISLAVASHLPDTSVFVLMMKRILHRAFKGSALAMGVSKCHLELVPFLLVFLRQRLTSTTADHLQVVLCDTFHHDHSVFYQQYMK